MLEIVCLRKPAKQLCLRAVYTLRQSWNQLRTGKLFHTFIIRDSYHGVSPGRIQIHKQFGEIFGRHKPLMHQEHDARKFLVSVIGTRVRALSVADVARRLSCNDTIASMTTITNSQTRNIIKYSDWKWNTCSLTVENRPQEICLHLVLSCTTTKTSTVVRKTV